MRNLLVLAFALCSFQALSQTAQAPKVSDDYLKMPGPEVQNLMLGTWSITVAYPPKAGQTTGDIGRGTEVWRPGPGGRSVIEEYHERNPNGETEGFGIAWWDEAAKGQRFVWCENDLPSGCYVSKEVFKWQGESLEWKEKQQSGGTATAYAEVFRQIRKDSFVQELQEGKALNDLHTTAMITASRIPDDQQVQMDSLRAAISARGKAMLEGDEQTVDSYTAVDYSQTDIFGRVQDKTTWISAYFRPLATLTKSGAFRWERYDEKDVQITAFENVAVVTGELSMKGVGAKMSGGQWEASSTSSIEGTLRFTRVWIRRDGKWMLVALHNAVPLKPEAKP